MSTEVLVPPLGQTVDTVTLVSWHKKEGDAVIQGEMLFAIETDKATLDIEAPASGVLRQVTARPGDEVQVLTTIALIAAQDEAPQEVPATAPQETGKQEPAIALPRSRASGAGPSPGPRPRLFVSPRARRLAETFHIPLAHLNPTGPEGAIVERDVRSYLNAQRDPLIQAKQIPVAEDLGQQPPIATRNTLNVEADATELFGLRERLAQDGVDAPISALVLYILGRALREHPRLNASWQGDSISLEQQIHIGLVLNTDQGSLVPVIADVDRKGLMQITNEYQHLIERVAMGRYSAQELEGATFTLTDLGLYGIDSFAPTIYPPQGASLGMGRIKTRSVALGDQTEARYMVWLSLAFDNKMVLETTAACFLQRVVRLIEQPILLLS